MPPPPPSPHAPPRHPLSSSSTAQTLSPHATHHHFRHRLPIHRSLSTSRRSLAPCTHFLHWKRFDKSFQHGLAAATSSHRAVSAPHRRPARSEPPAGKLAVSLWEHQEVSASPQSHHGNHFLHQLSYSAEASHLESCYLLKNKKSAGDGFDIRPISGVGEADTRILTETAYRSAKRIQLLKGAVILPTSLQLAEPGNRTSPTFIVKVLNPRRGQRKRMSVVAALHVHSDHARTHVQKLGVTHKLACKEYHNFLNGFSESNPVCEKERGKVKAAVLCMKEELEQEHRAKKRLETRNMKLSKHLTRTNKALRKAMVELDKERKSRELMEGMCNELAKEIEHDKLQMAGLKKELAGVREEVEEERNMLHLADMWREERLQMKLEDARLELEEEQQVVESLRSELELLKCRSSCEFEGADYGALSMAGMMQEAECSAPSPNKQFYYEQLEQLEFAMD